MRRGRLRHRWLAHFCMSKIQLKASRPREAASEANPPRAADSSGTKEPAARRGPPRPRPLGAWGEDWYLLAAISTIPHGPKANPVPG